MQEKLRLGLQVTLDTDFDQAVEKVTAALKVEGFGVLTEIDVKDTLKKKIDVDFRPYKILGACNPPLAHQALTATPEIGLLLPCNVTVSYVEDNMTEITLVDPMSMMSFVEHPDLQPIAADAGARLARVKASLEENN